LLSIKLKDATPEDREKQEKALVELISGDAQLRSKRELIEKFIRENLPEISDSDEIPEEFENFWTKERKQALIRLSEEENLDADRLIEVIGNYLFTEKKPMRDEVIGLLNQRPSLKERGTLAERITARILSS
jgi:type I restriction enzyme R subunit